LSMFKTGLLSGALLLTLEEKKHQKYFNSIQIVLFCSLLIVLNIISNYFRIITLVLFNCTEENVVHHTIGILCFVFYQILPMLFLIRFFRPKKEKVEITRDLYPVLFTLAGTLIVLGTSFEIKKEQHYNLLENLNPEYQNKKGAWISKEVFKIVTLEKLIYIKTSNHNPLVCWTGAGYKIVESKEVNRGNEKISRVKMEKNNVQYYSYWWYECNSKKYTSLIEVLLIKLFHNKPVRLINETSKV